MNFKDNMGDSYNYPPGADTPSAPWNQKDPEPIEVKVTASNTLSRSVSISTYGVVYEGPDEDGIDNLDFSNCDLKSDFLQECGSVKQILDEIVKLSERIRESEKVTKSDLIKLHSLADECREWNEDEFEVVRD